MAAPLIVPYANFCRVKVPSKIRVPDNPDGQCGFRFDNMPLAIPTIGQPPEERVLKMIGKMQDHLKSKHREHYDMIVQGAQFAFVQFMIAQSFHLNDPNAQRHAAILRAQIVIAAGKPYMPDDHIMRAIQTLNGNFTEETVFKLLAQMRDILTETGPQKEPALIVVP